MKSLWRKLLGRRSLELLRVGDKVHYRGRYMAVSRIAGETAELIWLDAEHQLHTAGFVPVRKLRTAP